MRAFVTYAAAAAMLAGSIATSAYSAIPSTAPSTAPAKNKLQCFDGPTDATIFGGACELRTRGAKGPATLSNTGGDRDGSYAGVYILDSNLMGSRLAEATQLSFNYTGIPAKGSPRISLPLDTDGDGVTDVYAFISAYWCSNGTGLVDAIHNPQCRIFIVGDATPTLGWAAFVAAYPKATMGPDGDLPFIIADQSGSTALWTVSNVIVGKSVQ